MTPEVGLRLLEMLGQLGAELEHEDAKSATAKFKLLQHTVIKVRCHQVAMYTRFLLNVASSPEKKLQHFHQKLHWYLHLHDATIVNLCCYAG